MVNYMFNHLYVLSWHVSPNIGPVGQSDISIFEHQHAKSASVRFPDCMFQGGF